MPDDDTPDHQPGPSRQRDASMQGLAGRRSRDELDRSVVREAE